MEVALSNQKLTSNRDRLLIVHFSCDELTKKYPQISSISTYDIKNSTYTTFSRKNDSETDELRMLGEFFQYLNTKINEKYILLGWYWADKFGIKVLLNRYNQLSRKRSIIRKITYFDLLKILTKEFPDFFGGLKSIAKFNDLNIAGFIDGDKEISLLKQQKYNELSQSSKAKVMVIYNVLEKYLNKTLKIPTLQEAFYGIKTISTYNAFVENIRYVKDLINAKNITVKNPELQERLIQLLYANVISAMETYLSDTFIRVSIEKPEFLLKYLSETNRLKDKKTFQEFYTELFKQAKSNNMYIDRYALNMCIADMREITFHNMDTSQNLYKQVFGVKLTISKEIRNAVYIRHDLVHRNGKDKNDNKINISLTDLENLVNLISAFIERTNIKVKKVTAVNDF